MKYSLPHLFTRIFCIAYSLLGLQVACANEWQQLFNGKNLDGWEKYVSYQPETNEYLLVSKHTPRGVNNDPNNIFSVTNGTLRVSGEEWGGLTTLQAFENFHLIFEMKWGEKKWPPRVDAPRDSGILYHAVGPHGAQSDHWMRSHEFQVQEGDCGDYHSLDGVLIDVHAGKANQGDWHFYRYDPTQPLQKNISSRVLKLGNYEKPTGEWNVMEVIVNGKTIVHKVNGQEVFRAYNSRQKDGDTITPLTKGKIQIQSEGAEVFYKNIRVLEL